MRADLLKLMKVLEASTPPAKIWQKPFDYDPSHYKRLCNLNGKPARASDLCNYALDMHYEQSPLQVDLFLYLLPICLQAWQSDIRSYGKSVYGGFVEYFWGAIASTPVFTNHLTTAQYNAVARFMADVILDCIDAEQFLHFEGMRSTPYTWCGALGAYCVVFPTLEALWNEWWEMKTTGQACAVLKYLSALIYDNDNNLLFAPWTPNTGGGPICLWEVDGFIYDRGWREENITFLQNTLTPNYALKRLIHATERLEGIQASHLLQTLLRDFWHNREILEQRLQQLPILLQTCSSDEGWSL